MVRKLVGKSAVGALALYALVGTASYGETMSTGAVAPSLKIDGFTAVNTYFVNQQRREGGRTPAGAHIGVDASNLFFTVMGKSASGIEYMYRITLETIKNTESVIDQSYVQFKSGAGTLQIGNVVGPEDTMIYDAGKIIGGTGGFDGAYNNVYNMSAGVMRGNDNIGDTGSSTKFVYYSPDFKGFQLGVSFTPTTAHQGDGKLDTLTPTRTPSVPGNRGLYEFRGTSTVGAQPFDLRNVAIGLTYKKEMGKWNITLSGAGITAKSYFFNNAGVTVNGVPGSGRVPMKNTKAYQLGAILGYGDFRFGGGYLDNGRSHLPQVQNFTVNGTPNAAGSVNLGSMHNGDAGRAFNLGAGYTMGAYQFAASYQRTTRNTGNLKKAQSDFYSATVDVTPLQGLKFYTEVDYIRSRTNDEAVDRDRQAIAISSRPWVKPIANNSGTLAIVGTKISF
ncbi:MAG: porin [Alphaproteobacteria bacterium]|jgi:hypothetical protein|nr:porin [Alphaproteobacteria bacterium]